MAKTLPPRGPSGQFIKALIDMTRRPGMLYPNIPAAGIGAGVAPGVTSATEIGGGVAYRAAGAAAPLGIGGRLQGILGKAGGKAGMGGAVNLIWLLPMLLSYMVSRERKKEHELSMLGIQAQHMREREEVITPESMFYQALMPQAAGQQQATRGALLQQLMGGQPQLAQGEEIIGV